MLADNKYVISKTAMSSESLVPSNDNDDSALDKAVFLRHTELQPDLEATEMG